MDLRLDRQVAVVTGSDSGIGQGIALLFAEHGADVLVHYHSDRDGAEDTASMVRESGRRAVVVQADVGEESNVEKLFQILDDTFGQIDILVNSAGHGGGGLVQEMTTDAWDRVLRTNLYGPFFCSRLASRRMIDRRKGGRIVNISSVHEEACSAGGGAYSVSKAGLRNLTRTQAIELAEYGITVNNVAPGMILTPMNQEAMNNVDARRHAEAQIPLLRAGLPADVAHMVLFLSSEAGSYCTGSTFFVDGGWMLTQPEV